MVLTGVMRMPGVTTLQAATPAPAMMDSLEMGSGVLLPNRLQSHWSVNQDTSHGARGVWVSMKTCVNRLLYQMCETLKTKNCGKYCVCESNHSLMLFQISMSAGMVLTGVMRMPGVTTLQAATPAPAMMDSLEMGSGVLLPNRLQSHWSVNQDTSHGARGVWVSMKTFLYIIMGSQ